MKFKFNKNLEHQTDAINAIVDVFDTGRNLMKVEESFTLRSASKIISNELEVYPKSILENLQTIQKQNKIDSITETMDGISSMDFSIEMETGTGKTYVYLRTILDLHKRYGLTKFIILVPSVAIREGVLKTLEQTEEHFKDMYNTGYNHVVYDSSRLSEVRDFAQSLGVQIMIMTIQSFKDETKVLRQTDRDDTYSEKSYIDLVAKTRPIVIMDEPQNMESEISQAAIGELKPLFRLRYSATHKELHNLMYRLTPVEAYRRGLVKKIQVYGVRDNDTGAFVFRVKDIVATRGTAPKATVVVEIKNTSGAYTA